MSLQSPPPHSQASVLEHQRDPHQHHHHKEHTEQQSSSQDPHQQQPHPHQHQHPHSQHHHHQQNDHQYQHHPHQHQRHPHHHHHHHHQQQINVETVCVYPEVRTAIIPTVHAVTDQMQLVSSSTHLSNICGSSSGNAQSHQQQQIVHSPINIIRPIAQHVYPPPLATHEEVLANRDLFMSTVTKLHRTLGTRLIIPKIGGKDLDLHLLYKEVTARGGLNMVVKERKWKEITLVFDFPPTTTSASFVLRKYYNNLLHHYEQVYFFQIKGPIITPPEPEYTHSPCTDPEVDMKKQKVDSAQALGVDPASSIGSVVTGYIDGKFDYGYLVNVMVGTRKMRGVMYHVPASNTIPQGATVSTFMNCLGADLKTAGMEHLFERRRKKKEITRKDPNAPRQNRTGYNFFFAEQRARLKSTQPDKDRAISRMIGDLWNHLSEEDKSPYQERGIKEKERYRREMSEYKERLRLQAHGGDGTSGSPRVLQIEVNYDHADSDVGTEFKLKEAKQDGTSGSPRVLQIEANNDHTNSDVGNEFKLKEVKQETIFSGQVVPFSSESGPVATGSIGNQSPSFRNPSMNLVENMSVNEGNPSSGEDKGI